MEVSKSRTKWREREREWRYAASVRVVSIESGGRVFRALPN